MRSKIVKDPVLIKSSNSFHSIVFIIYLSSRVRKRRLKEVYLHESNDILLPFSLLKVTAVEISAETNARRE